MTKLVEALLKQLKDNSYRQYRTKETESPILYPVDLFGFNMGCGKPLKGADGGNVSPNYKRIITMGFDATRKELTESISAAEDEAKKEYGMRMLEKLDECIRVCDEYRETVRSNRRLCNALQNVPHKGASTFYEACVFIKLCIYFLRIDKAAHLGFGRFDQYMYSFYENDKKNGVTDEEIFETLEAFFISINYDSDLYTGVQQGDNGQSMVLGGFDKEGNSMYNELSEMCMRASLELNLIDPKINLRVGKNTPDEIYVKATQLTKQGLGFPQYCNDDVVVPGLVKLGYEREDALNYVVAACWEYIIPNSGADFPNIRTFNFPLVVNNTLHQKLNLCESFDELLAEVDSAIKCESDRLIQSVYGYAEKNQPLLSLFIDGCIQKLADMWRGGAKYTNFGCHGAGISNAADALAAVKRCVFDEQTVTKAELLQALESNFEGFSELRNTLRSCPKMGNNDAEADDIAMHLMSVFSKSMNNRSNGSGGVWRAGTGSAMEYIFTAAKCPATADGRKASEPYSSSFSPSLDVKTNGLLSVIQSFTKYDMTDIINGGPLTLEIHDSVLRNDIGIEKTAQLVKLYVELGGHQLQLNSINRERLLDAQKNPEKYPNLIVRVWGWSGYFNELDIEFQNHVIRRCEYLG
ncbi:MAG: pyruvate formate-lyase [Oscillospiraceae bacterium]|nr:pyruvate formate-lyase [Oscillospiraceae bacterium]